MKRATLAAALAAAMLSGTAYAATTELKIYKQPDFRGASQTIKGQVDNLTGGFGRGVSSMVVRGGHWEVCTNDHFKGDCYVLAPGEYPRLDDTLDRRIVSIRFLGNDERHARRAYRGEARREARAERREEWREQRREQRYVQGAVDLYGRPEFRGRSVRIERNSDHLGDSNFDGRASSVIVHQGVWQLCSEPRFEGICRTYEPGQYAYLAELDDRVSSMRRIR